MWCELVMLPTGTGPHHAMINAHSNISNTPTNSTVTATGTGPPAQPTNQTALGLQSTNPHAYNTLAAAAAGLQYSSVPALTGLPINKVQDTKLSLPANLLVAQQLAAGQKVDTTNHFHIFVGDLGPEIEAHHLREAFSLFGIVTECKIIKDMHTQKPKGYGFVAYATKEEAEDGLVKMNGHILGSRAIRTNWAVRRPPQPPDQKPLDYDEVSQAASTSNCTVYVGGITKGLCEETLREAFKEYGEILEVRVFREKGYAFVRFNTHEGATRAIITMHGKEIAGQACKCSWGKESNDGKEALPQPILTPPYSLVPNHLNQLSYHYNPLTYIQPSLGYPSPYSTTATNGYRA